MILLYFITVVLCLLTIPILIKFHDYCFNLVMEMGHKTEISPTAAIGLALLSIIPFVNFFTLLVVVISFFVLTCNALPEILSDNKLNFNIRFLTNWMNGSFMERNKDVSKQ